MLVFSLLPKISLLILFYKIYYLLLIKSNMDLKFFLIFFILLSLIIGIKGAIKVNKINKLIAYSSISHMGFILLPLIIFNFESFLIYIIIYSFITLSIFGSLFTLINHKGKKISSIDQLVYLKKSNYFIFISLIISFFAISGIPPLSGFFSKFFIFINLINLNLYLLTFFVLILSVVSCFYYLRIIKMISFNNSKN
jgi:NADH-quinone oxidoreductase subunit N